MIKGTYVFSQDGQEIYRQSNVITKFGKRYLTGYLAGIVPSSRKDMAFGIDSTSATENDTRLGFEFYRTPVDLSTVDINTAGDSSSYAIIYKTSLPKDISGTISEIGIYPSLRTSVANYDSGFLSDFDSALDWQDPNGFNPNYDLVNAKIGENLLVFESDGVNPQEYVANTYLDLSGYSLADSVRLAYYKNGSNLSKIRVKLYSANNAYYYYDITPASGTGYKISNSILFSDIIANSSGGSPDQANIVKVGFEVYPTSGNSTSVGMDGFRINDEDTFDPIYGIISRAALTVPLEKIVGRTVDVEYRLDIGF